MEQPVPLYQSIESRLNGTLLDFVAARWPHKGWRKIAADIKSETGIDVSRETLRLWFADRITVETVVKVA